MRLMVAFVSHSAATLRASPTASKSLEKVIHFGPPDARL
jgi:hypothetical protein